jgi:aryl-alcohol dehydrogenase-like predicted oxidoreductase
MRYKFLGNSGLRVSELCLGTMTFGADWGWGASKSLSREIFDKYSEAGGNFIDTSVNYTNGTSEKYLGDFLKGRREHFVVATKYSLTVPEPNDPNSGGNSRKNMYQSVERSLRRLQTEYIDILYLHMWDYLTPVEEVMRGINDLVRSGKVHYAAISDTPSWIVAEANAMASLRGWPSFLGLQIPYSLLDRAVERSLLPMARHWDMAVMPWGLLEAGILTGKYMVDDGEPTRMDREKVKLCEKPTAVVREVQKISEETGRSMAQVAINWIRQQQHKSRMIPILGARTLDQLADNLAILEWELTEEQLNSLDEVSKIEMGFPHNFLAANPYIFGATFDKLDHQRL